MFRIWQKDGISFMFWITVLLLGIHRLRVSENAWHVSLLALPGLRLTCPVQTVKALLGRGRGHWAVFCISLHSWVSQEPWRSCSLPPGNVKSSFLMFPLTREGPSVLCYFYSIPVIFLKPLGTCQKWRFQNLTPSGVGLGLVWDYPAPP